MNNKEYKLPNGKTAVFEYDVCGIGKITLECMDELMTMVADRPQGEWERIPYSFVGGYRCSICGQKSLENHHNYCPNCGARMKGADDE